MKLTQITVDQCKSGITYLVKSYHGYHEATFSPYEDYVVLDSDHFFYAALEEPWIEAEFGVTEIYKMAKE